MHEIKEAHKASYIRDFICYQGTQYLMKYEWKKVEWENYKTVLERFKEKNWPKSINQRNK